MARKLAHITLILGIAALAYGAVTVLWGEPVTGVLAHRAQRSLGREFAGELRAPAHRLVPRRAAEGRVLGRITIPRLGLNAYFVEGTSKGDLERGPGHYRITALPGLGNTVAIAGHRTTWGAWFRHVDQLRAGDWITLELAYGAVTYRVMGQRVVKPDDWSILRGRGYHRLLLSTCDPAYSASHRRIVFAREVAHHFSAPPRAFASTGNVSHAMLTG
jgi:sortase A